MNRENPAPLLLELQIGSRQMCYDRVMQLHRGMERLERTSEQWRQERRQEMQHWRLSTTRPLWAMVGVTGGAFTVILAAGIQLVFCPGP